ncbi:MAG: GNAT family N-acetyltransferase [Nanoarchaeota archaeon]
METKRAEFASKAFRFSRLEEGVEIGRAYLFIIRNDLHEKPYYGLLEDVFVHEKYRKIGVAKKLIGEIIEEAKRQECYKLILRCNPNLREFYNSLGFKEVDKLEFRMSFE